MYTTVSSVDCTVSYNKFIFRNLKHFWFNFWHINSHNRAYISNENINGQDFWHTDPPTSYAENYDVIFLFKHEMNLNQV